MSKGLKEFAFMKGGQESKSQESKSFLSSLKGVFGNNASQVDEEDGKSDIKIKNNKEQDSAEDTGLISKYAGRLKDSLASNVIVNKSKSLMKGAQESVQTSVNFTKNLPYIIVLCVAGTLFMFLALFFLPLVIIAPSKFSFSFAIGSICYLSAIALVRDPSTFISSLLSKEKLKYTLSYAGSLLGTFYFALIAKSYFLSLFFCGAQVIKYSLKLN
mgnify:CR=1 FL=1|jgi:Membrane protein involved in ER to Golgi transport